MAMLFNNENFFTDSYSLARKGKRMGDIPTSDEISGIEVRLSKVLIKNNGTPKIPPFPGLAKMYLLVLVISDLEDPVKNLDLKGFAKVDDNEELPVDRSIFYWKKSKEENKNPGQIHVLVSVVKSKEDLRNVGNVLTKVKSDSSYNSLISDLFSSANQVKNITDTLFNIASIVGKYLGNVKDKPLLTWVQSFTDINGDLDRLGKISFEKENKNAEFKLTLIIRDKERERKALNSLTGEEKEIIELDIH